MDIFLLNKIIKDNTISDNGFMAYLALRQMIRKNEELCYVNPKIMYYNLSKSFNPTRQTATNLENGLMELVDKALVNICYKDKHEYEVDISRLIFNTKNAKETGNFYSIIDSEEIITILDTGLKYRFKLARFFCLLICTTIKKNINYGFIPAYRMRFIMGLDPHTISDYKNLLESLGLMYFYKSNVLRKYEDGEIHGIPDTYGRYKDKEEIIKKGFEYEVTFGAENKVKVLTKKSNPKTINKLRSTAQKYNRFIEMGERAYDYKERKKLYKAVKDYNLYYEKRNKTKVKDLSIFKGDDFYQEDDDIAG